MEKKPIEKKNVAPKTVQKAKPQNPAEKKPAAQDAASRKDLAASKRKARKRKKIMRLVCVLAGLVAVAAAVFFMNAAVIGGEIYPLSTRTIDLRNLGLSDAKSIARLSGLEEALLSGNDLADVHALGALKDCEYIDLTGNPVSASSYGQLRRALPGCTILCEVENLVTTELALGGYQLPDVEALTRVFAAHKALKTVDLRGTNLSQGDIDTLKSRFPNVNFTCSAPEAEGMPVVNVDNATEAMNALVARSDASYVTLTGYTLSTEEFRALSAQFPQMTVDCLVNLYGKAVPSIAEEIDLSGCITDEYLEDTLRLLPKMKKLTLSEMAPSAAAAMKASLGLDSLNYTYSGCLITAEATEIDLRNAPGLNGAELTNLLDALPQVETIYMSTPDAQIRTVIDGYRDRIRFVYELQAFNRTLSTTAESVDLGGDVTDKNVDELVNMLNQMTDLKEVSMYDSELSQENMDMLFDSYPDVFFGWTFTMCNGKYEVRSDVTAFSTLLGSPVHTFNEDDFTQLRYCKNLEALDLGHCIIEDISFLRNFPHMKLLILADNWITDLSPMADLKELQYLEIFLNRELSDYSPLAELPLTDLNIRKNLEVDVELIKGMTTLKRFWASHDQLEPEEVEELEDALPDCEISVTRGHSTDNGWRDTSIYDTIVRIFESRVYEPFR